MNIVWRFLRWHPCRFVCCTAFFTARVLRCLVVLAPPCPCWDEWENRLPGCPGCPGFCSLCLSYRFCPVKPLALFLKKKRTARPRPGHGGVGRAGIPSVASLFGGCTGPLRRPKKGPSLAATPPAIPSNPSNRSPGGPGSYSASAQAGGCFPVGARPPGRSGSAAAAQPYPLIHAGIGPHQPAR